MATEDHHAHEGNLHSVDQKQFLSGPYVSLSFVALNRYAGSVDDTVDLNGI
jgi:hypothetical protein